MGDIILCVTQSTQDLARNDNALTGRSMARVVWLTVDRKVETRVLAENSPIYIFSNACTSGLLSVRMHVLLLACMMYGLKCLVATAIPNASTSQGNQDTS